MAATPTVTSGPSAAAGSPVFIVGAPCSGARVLASSLVFHSKLAGGRESAFLASLARIYRRHFQNPASRYRTPLRSWVDEQAMAGFMRDFANRVFARVLQKSGKCIYVDHSPSYVNWLHFIDLLYPDARYIHVIRDGRWVAESMRARRGTAPGLERNAKVYADSWAHSVANGRKAGVRIGPGRYREVRYEQMHASPEPVLIGLQEFLGVTAEAAVVRAFERKRGVRREAENPGAPNTMWTSSSGWPPSWTLNQIQEFTVSAGELLVTLGYELADKAVLQ